MDWSQANILIMDDLCCCLADFGLSLFEESQALDSSSSRGSIRWLAPEYMDPNLPGKSYITGRDIYAYGCTVVEVGSAFAVSTLAYDIIPRSILASHLLVISSMMLVLCMRSQRENVHRDRL